MATFTAFYDSNVLYPAPLRDLLVELATTGFFRARWSDAVHEEWVRNLLMNRKDLKPSDLDRTRKAMNTAVLDCLVEGYESLVPGLHLPDPNDRHILAAAIHGRADVIVTMNLKDFPSRELSQYSIEAQHPDDFVSNLLSLSSEAVYSSVQRIRQRLKNPPRSVDQYLDTLERSGLAITTSQLRNIKAIL